MSDVQEAIEELVNEQVDSRIEDAISENHEIDSIKDDISELQDKLNGDFADEVTKAVLLNITTKLVACNDEQYIMVKKAYLESLQSKKEEGQNWGRKPPFSFYKNMDKITKSINLCYMRGTVLGLKEALVEVNKQELSLLKKVRILEEQIVALEKEDKE